MRVFTPEISWHSQSPLYSIDVSPRTALFKNSEFEIIATGGGDGFIGLWLYRSDGASKLSKFHFMKFLSVHVGAVNCVRFSPSGDYLATCGDDMNVVIWKRKDYMEVSKTGEDFSELFQKYCVLRGHIEAVFSMDWSSTSEQLVSGSLDKSVILWDIELKRYVHIFRDCKHAVQGCAWNGKLNRILVQSADGISKIYAADRLRVLRKITRTRKLTDFGYLFCSNTPKVKNSFQMFNDDNNYSFFRRCAFSPDGKFFILTGGVSPPVEENVSSSRTKSYANCAYMYSCLNPKNPLWCLPCGRSTCLASRFSTKFYDLVTGAKRVNTYTSTLNYRMVFALLNLKGIYIYDTQHLHVIGVVRNTHLLGLTDLSWFDNGSGLIVSSQDGYCTFIEFDLEELGHVTTDLRDNVLERKRLTKSSIIVCDDGKEVLSESDSRGAFPKTSKIVVSDSQPVDIARNKPIGNTETTTPVKAKRVAFTTLKSLPSNCKGFYK